MELEDMKETILSILRTKHLLLILDNTEDPLEHDERNFKHALNEVVDEC
jgi:hypothetical protein